MEKFEIVNGNVKCHSDCRKCSIYKYATELLINKIIKRHSMGAAVRQLVNEGKISVDDYIKKTQSDCAIVYEHMYKEEMEKKIEKWKSL